MKQAIKRLVVLITVSLLFCVPIAAEKRFLSAPEVSWEDLQPYVMANLRVEYREDAVFVGVSGASRERELFEPYDHIFGEWATVLLGQLLTDRKLRRVVKDIARDLAKEQPDVVTMEREELTRLYWARLESDGRFVTRLGQLFRRAQMKGRLRCLICERGFEPQFLRWQ